MSMVLGPARAPLRGAVEVPGDKSISHRIALLAPLASGPCRARGWLVAADTISTLEAVRALGAQISMDAEGIVSSPGGFPAVCDPDYTDSDSGDSLVIDCGNSGTTARLLLGLLAGRRVRAIIDGDASLRRRPMGRVLRPLRRFGSDVRTRDRSGRLPAEIRGRPLKSGKCRLAVPSAQAKSALLLAGLSAPGPVTVAGCGSSRDHTERLLSLMGADITVDDVDGGRARVAVTGPLQPFDLDVPGDFSSAAFLLAAAAVVPGSEITVRGVSLNPTRTGFLRVLENMGADLTIRPEGGDDWEPRGSVTLRHGPLGSFRIHSREIPGLIDELPILAVLGAYADGVSVVSGAGELRIKESDRISVMVDALRGMGIPVQEAPDGFVLTGPVVPGAGRGRVSLKTAGDHRVAMALAICALGAGCETELDDTECVAVSFPGFFELLTLLQGKGGS